MGIAIRANAVPRTEYYWGDRDPKDFAWYGEISKRKTHPVGEKLPNGFGLFDMAGNVEEWVQNCWLETYEQAPADGSAWKQLYNGNCSRRAARGGSWDNNELGLRSAYRPWKDPIRFRLGSIGFRLAQDID